MELLKTDKKNKVLASFIKILNLNRGQIIAANKLDLDAFGKTDRAMYDRLVVDDKKVDSMVQAVTEVMEKADPVGQVKSTFKREDGLEIINKTAPFGTIMMIYESRPDVTVEAAVLGF